MVPRIDGITFGTLTRLDYRNSTERKLAAQLRFHEVPLFAYPDVQIVLIALVWACIDDARN